MKWTTLEEQYLLNNYKHVANADLARRLGRSLTTVQRKLCNMGLRRTDEQLRIIYRRRGETYGGVPMEAVLTPAQCEVMRDFLRQVLWAHKYRKVPIDRQEEMGGVIDGRATQ